MSFGSLYIGVSGLLNQRTSLNTVSHNMANTENPNYVRQSALHANNYYRGNGRTDLQVGTGSKISQIRQIRDGFLDIRFRAETSKYGFHQAKDEVLAEVETIFAVKDGKRDTGLPEVMKLFWQNAEELYKHPEALTNRGLMYQQGLAVADTFHRMANQLDDLRQNLNREIFNKIERINVIFDRVREINQVIRTYEGASPKIEGTDANGVKVAMNDLRDERNALVDELSTLVPITTHQNYDGEVLIHINGRLMVGGDFINHIVPKADPRGLFIPKYEDDEQPIYSNLDVPDHNLHNGDFGILGGLIRVRDVSVPKYESQLDEYASMLAEKINELHIGYGLKDTAFVNDRKFFQASSGNVVTAANIQINPELADLNKIIAAKEKDKVGDGSVFKSIVDLRDGKWFTKGTKEYTFDEYFRDTFFEIGVERQESRSIRDAQLKSMMAIDERRKEISGVSLDEEMADMLKYQHAYSASSRVINVVDEMMDQVVNRLGLVGR